MTQLVSLVAVVFGVTFLAGGRLAGGWFWDTGNALGFLAFAGLLYQCLPPHRPGSLKTHEVLGYVVAAVVALHAVWLLAGDGAVRIYLLPGAPAYMWLGLAGLIALVLILVLALPSRRNSIHGSYRAFRVLHRRLAIAAVVLAGIHILGSGFYVANLVQGVMLVAISAAVCFLPDRLTRPRLAVTGQLSAFLATGFVAVVLFALLRNGPA